MTAAAKNDPFKALATLHAIQKRVPGVSDSSLYAIWVLRHPDFCREIYELSNLNDNGDLPYAAFRGADSLEAVAPVWMSDGFLPFEDHSGGGFYATTLAAVCGVDDGVVEVALRALEKKSKARTRGQADDATFTEAVRKGVKEEGKPVAVFPYDGTVGGKERVHKDRFVEKTISEQLFGRFGRELVLAAVAALNLNVESMSEDEIVAAVKKKLAVHNRVFMSEPLFTALAMRSGAVYRDAGKGITAFGQDFEGIAVALTGGMIKTGGLNVAPLGCEAEWWALKYPNDAHFASCFLRDVAFAEAAGGDTAAFYEAYDDVKTRLAMEVFSDELRMMQRLAATSVLLKEEGPDALAKADAEIFRLPGAECPTYDTIDAGTFARALAAENGRTGGSAVAKLVRDYYDPEVEQSPENKQKAERILFSGIPAGKMTGKAKSAHVAKCEAGGGCLPGEMTGEAKLEHVAKTEAGGGKVAGVATTAQQRLKAVIGRFAKKKEDGTPIAVSRVIMHTASENTYTFYVSRDASLEEYNAFFFQPFEKGCHAEELHHIMRGTKRSQFILPLSNDSRCEGAAIGGTKNRDTGAWRCWSLEAYNNLKKEGVTWSVENFPITDAMLGAHALEKAATKAARKSREKQAAKERKNRKHEAPSAPGPGLVKKRRTT